MRNNTTFSACIGCAERAVGCHGKCPKYKAAKAEYDQESERILKAKAEEDLVDDFKARSIDATNRRYNKKRGRR